MVGEVWRIGDVKISRIVEIEATGGMTRIIPDATRERVMGMRWLQPHFADQEGRMRGSIHALLVETPSIAIVVDTCVGNDKERALGAWNHLQTGFLDDLKSAGKGREEVDRVLCTHLHVDHVGWNTMWVDGKWVPTFPNARYLMGRKEFEHWRANAEDGQADVMADSVMPVYDAGRAGRRNLPGNHADPIPRSYTGPRQRPYPK
jgi:glyoxylase-like metal-dependent hydrolase (beta-lactamase superfamily II)